MLALQADDSSAFDTLGPAVKEADVDLLLSEGQRYHVSRRLATGNLSSHLSFCQDLPANGEIFHMDISHCEKSLSGYPC